MARFSYRFIMLCAFLPPLLLGVGYYLGALHPREGENVSETSCHRTLFLLDQSLDCEKVESIQTQVESLERKISQFITEQKEMRNADRISVFYRDLSTRRWFGVNADERYYPASLAKLPLAIAYYKVSDLEPTIFDQNLELIKSGVYVNTHQKVSVDSPMVVGKTYSIRRMVEDMLVYSDNRPIGPLTSFLRPDAWKKVYADLGILKQSEKGDDEWTVTPRSISLVFRSLYNGSYLDLTSSQELLEVMTRAQYHRGLVAGIPGSIRVAHKFGEATMLEESGRKIPILHDCGIIYTENPYILCVMSEGENFEKLEKVIADISREVFQSL